MAKGGGQGGFRTVFADTYFYRALLDKGDGAHRRAVGFTKGKRFRIVTTEFVLVELGDEFRLPGQRKAYLNLVAQLRSDPLVRIVPASENLYELARKFYGWRADKEWGMTDCTSFVVMGQEGLHEALTGDHHFEQAGFVAVLK
jgi:predicted nucleic acid-binding protein